MGASLRRASNRAKRPPHFFALHVKRPTRLRRFCDMETRVCLDTRGQGCRRTLPIATGFYTRKVKRKDGSLKVSYARLCRDCQKARIVEWREANPERHAEVQRRAYLRNAEQRREQARQRRAEKGEQ